MDEQNHYIYEFGPYRLDARRRRLSRDGEKVPLTSKAFDTLLALVESCDRVIKKDELMRRVWPDTTVEEGNLALNISNLRKALGDAPDRHDYIATIHGEGYQFVATVRAFLASERARVDEMVVHESTTYTFEEELVEVAAANGGLEKEISTGEQKDTSLHSNAALVSGRLPSPLLQSPLAAPSMLGSGRSSRRGMALLVVALSIVGAALSPLASI